MNPKPLDEKFYAQTRGRVWRNPNHKQLIMKIPEIKPGREYITNGGHRARIYAVDGAGHYPIHGAIWMKFHDYDPAANKQGWWWAVWNHQGEHPEIGGGYRIIGPWISEVEQAFWANLPKWANFAAKDGGSNWFWYDKKPTQGNYTWIPAGLFGIIPKEHVPMDWLAREWSESFSERPADTDSIPDKST